jgi:hypothetical protein
MPPPEATPLARLGRRIVNCQARARERCAAAALLWRSQALTRFRRCHAPVGTPLQRSLEWCVFCLGLTTPAVLAMIVTAETPALTPPTPPVRPSQDSQTACRVRAATPPDTTARAAGGRLPHQRASGPQPALQLSAADNSGAQRALHLRHAHAQLHRID